MKKEANKKLEQNLAKNKNAEESVISAKTESFDAGGKSKSQKCRELFWAYLKSMALAFTGGPAVLPILQEQLDDKYHLMSKEEVLEFFALGQTLPGAISLNAGLLTGRKIAGVAGAAAASIGIIFPAVAGMLLIAGTYQFASQLEFIKGAIEGIRAASIAIILANAGSFMNVSKKIRAYLMIAASFIATFFFNCNILLVMLICGVLSIFIFQDEEGKKS